MMASIWVVSESNLGWEEVWILAPAPTFYSQSLLLHPCWILWPLPTKLQLHGAGHLGAHLEGANRAGTYTLMLKAQTSPSPDVSSFQDMDETWGYWNLSPTPVFFFRHGPK